MKVLVTGATGLIGSHITKVLHREGYEVVATGRKDRDDLPVPIHRTDLSDWEQVRPMFDGVDAVIHMANPYGWTHADLNEGYLANLTVHSHVLEASRQAGVKRIIFASSVHSTSGILPDGDVLPDAKPAYLPLDENIPPIHCNPYGISKICTDHALEYLSLAHGTTTISLRIPLVPTKMGIDSILAGTFRPYRYACNDGFAYMAASDMAELNEALLRADLSGHNVFFPASDKNMFQKPVLEVIDEHYADVPLRLPREEITSLVDLRRICEITGWAPTI